MTSSYTANSGLEKPDTGDQEGAWGGTLNTNFDIIDRVLSGVGSVSLSGTTHTLTTTDGTLTDGMYRVLLFTGALGANNTITISPNDQDKLYFIVNNTTDSGSSGPYSVIIKQGTGDTVTIENGRADIVYADGAGSGADVISLGTEIGQRAFDLYTYTATEGQTTFTGSDTASKTLAYSAGNLFVTLNGVTLENGTDYTATNGTSVVLTDAASLSDELNIYAFNAFSVANVTTASADFSIGDDLSFTSDAAVINMGANSDVTITHVHDTGLNLKNTNTGDDKPMVLTLQTGETDIAASDVLGKIQFQAPDEGTGTDAILVAAEIAAVSEGDFSSSSNATSLSFKTGASEAATQKMVIASGGEVGIGAAASSVAQLYTQNTSADHYVFYGYQAATGTAYPAMYILQKGDNAAIYGQCDGDHYGVRGYSHGSYGAYFSTATSGELGRGMYAVGEGKYFIGGMSDSTYGGYSNGAYWSTTNSYAGSDSRLKDVTGIITTSDGILAKVNQLKPVMFKWKANTDGYVEDASPQCGFLAQEVETIFPDLIDEVETPDMSGDEYDNGRSEKNLNEQLGTTYGMTYEKVCVYLTAALQELSAKNDALEARIKVLEDA